jgi:DNA modification methylase
MTETTATRGATLLCGDARAVLAGMPARSVHTCITSPPYYGLRAYNGGTAELGTEQTPQEYVAALVAVFHGVYRVLRDDGTCWIVIGDCYAGSWGNQGRKTERGTQRPINGLMLQACDARYPAKDRNTGALPPGIRAKSLMGIPWRVAFALQDDGWIVRQEVIWHKSNPMPESVKDRCTRGHETVFMLAKQGRYYYDQDAIREEHAMTPQRRLTPSHYGRRGVALGARGVDDHTGMMGLSQEPATFGPPAGRNKRSVWTVATAPLSSEKFGCDVDHYAAFPPELVRPMVRASCRPDAVVLDPFAGACTTALVALQEGRRAIMIDLNADYLRLGDARLRHELGLFYGAPAIAV